MKRFALVAAILALSACNSAAKQKAMEDSVNAATAAAAADSVRKADSMRVADSVKMAEMNMKKAPDTKSTTKSKM